MGIFENFLRIFLRIPTSVRNIPWGERGRGGDVGKGTRVVNFDEEVCRKGLILSIRPSGIKKFQMRRRDSCQLNTVPQNTFEVHTVEAKYCEVRSNK